MALTSEIRRGSRLGSATATFIEQVAGQHNSRRDGQTIVVEACAWLPAGEPTEAQQRRASSESESDLYVPRGLPDVSDWLCTVVPGPENEDGSPRRLAVVGQARPFWRRNRSFSHSQVLLRDAVS